MEQQQSEVCEVQSEALEEKPVEKDIEALGEATEHKLRRLDRFPKIGLINQIFKREYEIRKAVAEYRADPPKMKMAIKGHAFVSNPTENTALKNLTPIHKVTLDDGFYVVNPELWLKAIDATYRYFTGTLGEVLRMKANGYNYIQICMRLHVSQSNVYKTLEKAENYALAVACQYGLVKIVDEPLEPEDEEELIGSNAVE